VSNTNGTIQIKRPIEKTISETKVRLRFFPNINTNSRRGITIVNSANLNPIVSPARILAGYRYFFVLIDLNNKYAVIIVKLIPGTLVKATSDNVQFIGVIKNKKAEKIAIFSDANSFSKRKKKKKPTELNMIHNKVNETV